MADNNSASQELLCIQEEGPEDFFLVPFPIVLDRTLIMEWGKELQDYFSEDSHFILKHPDSDVGVECLIGSFDSDFDEPVLLSIPIYPFYRVNILSSRVDDEGMTFVRFEKFTEEKISRKDLQDRITGKIIRFVELAVKFHFMLITSNENVDVETLNVNTIEENEVGPIVDSFVNWLNGIIYEEGIEDGLVSILEERNVEERLDKAIALYEWCFDEERSWIQELRSQGSEDFPILPRGATGEEQSISSENILTASQLLHHRIFEIGPEEQSPDPSLSGGENGSSKPDDPNSRENLIRRRIYKKGGDENADSPA